MNQDGGSKEDCPHFFTYRAIFFHAARLVWWRNVQPQEQRRTNVDFKPFSKPFIYMFKWQFLVVSTYGPCWNHNMPCEEDVQELAPAFGRDETCPKKTSAHDGHQGTSDRHCVDRWFSRWHHPGIVARPTGLWKISWQHLRGCIWRPCDCWPGKSMRRWRRRRKKPEEDISLRSEI